MTDEAVCGSEIFQMSVVFSYMCMNVENSEFKPAGPYNNFIFLFKCNI